MSRYGRTAPMAAVGRELYSSTALQDCRNVGMDGRGVLGRRCGCGARWRNDVPLKVDTATKRYVMDHQGSTAKQLHPRRPVASSRRASTFIALARSTTQQPASPTSPPLPAPSRPTTPTTPSASTYFLSSPSTARQPPSNFSPPCRREYSRVDAQAAPGSHSSSSCC